MDTKEVVATSIGTAGAGAALMFFLDPDEGNKRRAFVRDKVLHIARQNGGSIGKAARDLGNRTRGMVSEAKSRMAEQSGTDDEVLAERVRSKIGRVVSYPRAIEVSVRNGVVTLRGDVLRSETRRLMSEAYSVRDVKEVRNDLKTHSDESGVPGFEGNRRERSTWGRGQARGVRLALGAAGGVLAVVGAVYRSRRHPILGNVLSSAGIGLLGTEIANSGFSQLARGNSRD
jgi:BON domain